MTAPLLIRDTVLDALLVDVAIVDGKISAIGRGLPAMGAVLDARGGALLPGLHDHHLHLFGLAAQLQSVNLAGAASADEVAARLGARARELPEGSWLRATGYHESLAGPLDRALLDRWLPDTPVRVQYATGTLWAFNSAGLARLQADHEPQAPLERDERGRPTGRLWHGDAWLKQRLRHQPPPFAPVGRLLAAAGITGVTDASVTTGAAEAALLAAARAAGELPQRLWLMSGGMLQPHPTDLYRVGPVKVMLHEARLPAFEALVATVRQARDWQRCVAFHCVTPTELAYALAALDQAGAQPGDRIEHGAIMDDALADELAARGLAVVTQPAFIADRGDAYLRDVDASDREHLYRCGTLLARGVPVAASSDAPYGPPDPWSAIRAASERRTASGRSLAAGEAIAPLRALQLFLGPAHDPGGAPRRVSVGAPADLCLLDRPLDAALRAPAASCVAATLVAGAPVYVAEGSPT